MQQVTKEIEMHITMPRHKPWFLMNKLKHGSIGEWSHLTREDLFELLYSVDKEIAELYREHHHHKFGRIRKTALKALERLAQRHHCVPKLNAEGGDVCFYYHDEPVFALSVRGYMRDTVERLLKSRAFYRGIIDCPALYHPPLPEGLPSKKRISLLLKRINERNQAPRKSHYYMLPVHIPGRRPGKWRQKEALDMADILEWIKEHPNIRLNDIREMKHMGQSRVVRLMGWLEKRGLIYRMGGGSNTGWYASGHRPKNAVQALSSSDDFEAQSD
jgi:hypothetical protein